MCVYVYIYVYVLYIYIYTHKHMYMYVCVYTYIYIYTYVYMGDSKYQEPRFWIRCLICCVFACRSRVAGCFRL